mgnify:FL=1
MAKWFVTMTDKFMSGWGHAQGRKAKLVIGPMKWDEALRIERAALRRSEMKYVNIREAKGKPKNWYGSDQVSVKKLSEVGGSWKVGPFWKGRKK